MGEFDRNNLVMDDEKTRKKKMLVTGMIICVALIIFLACMVLYYKNVDAKTFKLFVNDVQVACSQDFLVYNEEGRPYIKIAELAGYIGWSYQNGEFGSYTEDTNSGYIQNEYEAASFKVGSNKLKKYIQVSSSVTSPSEVDIAAGKVFYTAKSPNGTLETTELELPVISMNNQIYVPFEYINDICNCNMNFQNYRMYIYEQEYMANLARTNAYNWGYTSLSGVYENIRALSYGMMVVEKNGTYGVVSVWDNSSILGFKYTDMTFNQNVKEFFVKTKSSTEETVGLVAADGNVIISPKKYENISILSDELGLYLVEKDDKYGVLNRNGEIVVHAEFDSIGLPDGLAEVYGYTSEDNKYLIYNNTIVVENNGKYGFYNLEGKEVLEPAYDGVGYTTSIGVVDDEQSSSSSKNQESVLTIKSEIELDNGQTGLVNGIVVQYNRDNDSWYGVYDAISEKLIVPCGCSKIYSITKSGKQTYYMEFNGEQIEFNSYAKAYELYTVSGASVIENDLPEVKDE